MIAIHTFVRHETETATVAALLAARLRKGDVVLIDGRLGAGKTAFVQAAVSALGSESHVTSPTFGLAHFYNSNLGEILHVDTYRLRSLAEFRDLGLEDYLADSIAFIEWGKLASPDYRHALRVLIEFVPEGDANQRRLTLSSTSPRWAQDLEFIKERLETLL